MPAAPRPPKKFVADPFDYHEEIELEIESLANLGQGVGRTADGWVVFVPFTIPGERVKARIFRNYKAHSDADLIEVLTPDPSRQDPKCPLFGTCGGCQYQHIPYERQIAWKRSQVEELLVRLAEIKHPVDPVEPSPIEYAYRSKITPHFHKPKGGKIDAIGFLRAGTRGQVIDVPHCPIASDAINAALPAQRKQAFDASDRFKNGATLLLRDAGGKIITGPREVAEEKVGDLTFHFLAGDFFQNNPAILPAFTGHAADEAAASGNKFLIDAYCGSGLFCLTAASRFESVAGIELSESSADWARRNATTNNITNASFHAGSAEAIFEKAPFPAEETSVIIDPPRKGCSEDFIEQLAKFKPNRVVYVSCNPATQMRDLALLRARGFELKRVRPFDLFPQTRHLECVITLDYIGDKD